MIDHTEEKNTAVLLARLDDMCEKADRGELCTSSFLTPAEQQIAREHLSHKGIRSESRCVEWGGYPDAERKKFFLLPEYMEGVGYSAFSEYGYEDQLAAIEVMGSGFKRLTHRDFLGSVLGLGLQRSVIGDIFLSNDDKGRVKATVICESTVADFICANLTKVGSDTVCARIKSTDEISAPQREYKHISDTVSSARVDCVVASVLSVSREKAKLAITEGIVEVDYKSVSDPSKQITAPCLLAVRGHGKFRINSLADKTKKGRLRLDADKYI